MSKGFVCLDMVSLRPYQSDLISKTRFLMQKGCRSILLTAPTGSGKTLLTAWMLKACAAKGQRAFFVVHRRELVKQSIRAFAEVGLPYGVISAGWWEEPKQPVQIASVQSLIRRHHKYAKPNLIVWDECHHLGATSWENLHNEYPGAYHVGLTATPCRLDGKGLGKYFKEILCGPSVSWLIENGFLSKYRLFAPPSVSMRGVPRVMGDYDKTCLNAVMDRPTITGDAVAHYQKLAADKRAVVFAVSIEHSKHIVSQFQAAGIEAEHVDGETAMEVRDEAIERFRKGDLKILSNVELFGEGFDIDSIEVALLLRPTQSVGLYLQQIGRSLRPFDGKENAIILDHAGNCARHGLPDEDRNWSLERGAGQRNHKTEDGISVKICPRCYACMVAGSSSCKFCGFIFEIASREIKQVDGILQEIDSNTIRWTHRHEQGAARDFESLVALGRARKYKRPYLWAKYVWNARQAKKLVGNAGH